MRSRDIIGRRIVAIDQERFYNDHIGQVCIQLNAIELDDGSRISFMACERETEPYVEGTHWKTDSRWPKGISKTMWIANLLHWLGDRLDSPDTPISNPRIPLVLMQNVPILCADCAGEYDKPFITLLATDSRCLHCCGRSYVLESKLERKPKYTPVEMPAKVLPIQDIRRLRAANQKGRT